MLVELRTADQLKTAVETTSVFPDYLLVHFSLQSILDGNFPAAPARAFAHTDSSDYELYIVVRKAPNRYVNVHWRQMEISKS